MPSTLPSVNTTDIALDEYPQLKRLAWHLPGVSQLSPSAALNLCERHWRHVDHANLSSKEIALINRLAASLGGGRLLV